MAVFVVINYYGIKWFARVNNVLVWWKIAIILLVIGAFMASAFHTENFTDYGFMPEGWHGVFTAIATSGIVFSYLGFRQGIELAGETDNPKRNVPIAVIGSVLLTALIYILLQVAFIAALPHSTLADSGSWAKLSFEGDFGPLAAIATLLGLGWLSVLLYADAIISPGDTGLIYTTVTSRISYAMARNGNAPQALAEDHRPRRPVHQPDRDLRRRHDRLPAVPELAAAGRLHHLGDRALLRLRPARPLGAAQAAARPGAARSGSPAATSSRSWPSGRPT